MDPAKVPVERARPGRGVILSCASGGLTAVSLGLQSVHASLVWDLVGALGQPSLQRIGPIAVRVELIGVLCAAGAGFLGLAGAREGPRGLGVAAALGGFATVAVWVLS